jgi:hypothetical protein
MPNPLTRAYSTIQLVRSPSVAKEWTLSVVMSSSNVSIGMELGREEEEEEEEEEEAEEEEVTTCRCAVDEDDE